MQPSQLQQEANQSMAQGHQLLSSDINNANQYQQQYGNYQGQADAAKNNLQQYTQYLQGAGNPTNLYQNQLQNAFTTQGFNPQSLATATQNLTQSQNALQNLYNAQQTGTGGYGLTGGQLGNYYSTLSTPLQQQVGAQNTAVNNLQQLYQNALTQAQQGTQAGYQGEQLTSQNLNQVYQNAQNQAAQALSQMQFYSTLANTQGGLNATMAQGYAKALGDYQQAIATANNLNEQTRQAQNQYNQYLAQQAAVSGNTAPSGAQQVVTNNNGQVLGFYNPNTLQDVLTNAGSAQNTQTIQNAANRTAPFNIGDAFKSALSRIV